MISGLDPSFDYPRPATGIFGRIRQHFGKNALVDVVGTRPSSKDAARPEEPHGPIVDFLVASEGAFEALLILGKSRWVQNNRIVAHTFLVTLAEEVKRIGLDAIDILQAVSL